ncbi:MFS transporter [Phytomonospora sp. NPDC050363]|uniref:MFS transporter n=1 Tax=Phytomonospora sp. NPDC050363 TaxID=3155642 RepID=UPI00340E9644
MDPRRARIATAVIFAAHGAVTGSFAARLPALKSELGLGSGALGAALMAQAIGAFTAMTLTSRLIHRFGERDALRMTVLAWTLVLPIPALMPEAYSFAAAMFVFGAAAGSATVTTNAAAVLTEEAVGRSIMTGLHGMWSVGNLAGAAVGALAVVVGLDVRVHFALVSAVLVPLALIGCRFVPHFERRGAQDAPARFALPTRAVLVIGFIGLCSAFIEGTTQNWSGIYLEQITGATAALAAFGYTVYMTGSVAVRILGDFAVRRLGPVPTVRIGASVAALGALLVTVASVPAVAIGGFALIGVGTAVIVPLAVAAGGRAAAVPAHGVAGVMTVTFTGSLVAPGAVGGIADLSSLRVSFGVVTAVGLAMVFLAGVVRPRERPSATPPPAKADSSCA